MGQQAPPFPARANKNVSKAVRPGPSQHKRLKICPPAQSSQIYIYIYICIYIYNRPGRWTAPLKFATTVRRGSASEFPACSALSPQSAGAQTGARRGPRSAGRVSSGPALGILAQKGKNGPGDERGKVDDPTRGTDMLKVNCQPVSWRFHGNRNFKQMELRTKKQGQNGVLLN